MQPDSVEPDDFDTMVVDAIDSLPDWVIPIVAEIAVIVERGLGERPASRRRQR